jgi:hypothetical protein
MNFTSITNFVNIFKQGKTPLGRWNIHNYKETTLKIDYANEDNCGISSNKQKHINIPPVKMPIKQIGGLKIYNPQGDYYHISSRDYINILYSAKAKEKERKQQQQDDDKYMFMMGFESAHN